MGDQGVHIPDGESDQGQKVSYWFLHREMGTQIFNQYCHIKSKNTEWCHKAY